MRWTTTRSSRTTAAGTASTADHNYNWHDSIHTRRRRTRAASTRRRPATTTATARTRPARRSATTAAGNQIGVAPGAKWIGCRNMDHGDGTPATLHRVLPVLHRADRSQRPEPGPDAAPARDQQQLGLPAERGLRGRHACRRSSRTPQAAGIFVVVSAGNARLGLLARHGSAGDLRRLVLDRRDATATDAHRRLQQPRPGDRRRLQPHQAGHRQLRA